MPRVPRCGVWLAYRLYTEPWSLLARFGIVSAHKLHVSAHTTKCGYRMDDTSTFDTWYIFAYDLDDEAEFPLYSRHFVRYLLDIRQTFLNKPHSVKVHELRIGSTQSRLCRVTSEQQIRLSHSSCRSAAAQSSRPLPLPAVAPLAAVAAACSTHAAQTRASCGSDPSY